MRGRTRRAVWAFGRFWWEFLIGETPELFVGMLLVVGAAALLRHDRAAGLTVMVLVTVVILLGSVYRGRSTPVARRRVGDRVR
jgi:ABC-type spermidine/putrescine transport system permease subunit I